MARRSGEKEEEEDDDGEGWMKPSAAAVAAPGRSESHANYDIVWGKSLLEWDAPPTSSSSAASGGRGVGGGREKEAVAGCLTTDFAMQNVMLQLGLRLLSLQGRAVKRLKSWVLKCDGCRQIIKVNSIHGFFCFRVVFSLSTTTTTTFLFLFFCFFSLFFLCSLCFLPIYS